MGALPVTAEGGTVLPESACHVDPAPRPLTAGPVALQGQERTLPLAIPAWGLIPSKCSKKQIIQET